MYTFYIIKYYFKQNYIKNKIFKNKNIMKYISKNKFNHFLSL